MSGKDRPFLYRVHYRALTFLGEQFGHDGTRCRYLVLPLAAAGPGIDDSDVREGRDLYGQWDVHVKHAKLNVE
jgi:hypothetical protein